MTGGLFLLSCTSFRSSEFGVRSSEFGGSILGVHIESEKRYRSQMGSIETTNVGHRNNSHIGNNISINQVKKYTRSKDDS